MTTRMHRGDAAPTASAMLQFNASPGDAVAAVHARIPAITAHGATLFSSFHNTTALVWVTALGQTAQQARAATQPVADLLAATGIPHTHRVELAASFVEHYSRTWGPLPDGLWPTVGRDSSRLLPRALLKRVGCGFARRPRARLPRRPPPLIPSFSAPTIAFRPLRAAAAVAPNAMHPAWRAAGALAVGSAQWDWRAAGANDAHGARRRTRTRRCRACRTM
jgi:hypothetical protein